MDQDLQRMQRANDARPRDVARNDIERYDSISIQ